MMIKVGSGDRPEEHLNPSRRKIPNFKQNTPSTASTQRERPPIFADTASELPIKRCLFSDMQKKESSTETPQCSAVFQQNQYLKDEIARFEEINRRLQRHIDCRDKHLSKLHQDLKEMLLKYNDEVTRMKDDLYRELQQSRRSHEISHIRPNNNSDDSMHSRSSASSLENILQIKETLDRMDFKFDPCDPSYGESLAMESSPAKHMPFRF